MKALIAIDLGNPLVISYLKEAVGSPCIITASGDSAPRWGRLAGVDGGRPLLEMSDLQDAALVQVMIQIPARNLVFESRVMGSTDRGWALSYPLWIMGPERRRALRKNVSLPVEVIPGSGGSSLMRGTLTNISLSGFRLSLLAPIASGSPFRLAFPLPGHPLPMRVTATVVWLDREGEQVVVGGVFGVLSLQTEATLIRFLNAAAQEGADNVCGAG